MDGWVKVYTSSDIYFTEILRQILEENKIPVVCLNRRDSSYLLGIIELYVPPSLFNLAIEIIIFHDQEIN